MAKQIKYHIEARDLLIKGVNEIAKAVGATMGPKGSNAIIDKGFGTPTITKDGVSVAKEIELEDKFENMGAELVKEAANKTNELAGDGTTTAVILAQSMINTGTALMKLKSPELKQGINVRDVQEGIELAVKKVVEYLDENADKVEGSADKIKNVATISANNDEEIGQLVAEVIEQIGKDGVITVEESQTFGLSKEVVEGTQFDKGYVSPYMITSPDRMEAEYKDAHILITDKKVSALNEILPLLEKLAQAGKKELVIIADEVEGEALATFVVNKLRGTFNVLAVKAPGFGDRRKEMLEDIAILTSGKVISEDIGLKLENTEIESLGQARRVVATKENTTIVEGKGDEQAIKDRVAQIKKELKDTTSDFDKEKLQERLGKLGGGVAVLKVGAATESEMKEKKDRIEDALHATRAAIEEGIVSGGGSVLMSARFKCFTGDTDKNILTKVEANSDKWIGMRMITESLTSPFLHIAENAAKHGQSILTNVVLKMAGKAPGSLPNVTITDPEDISVPNAGYDAKKDSIVEDMIEQGIIDPVKVTKAALQNAASVATLIITSSVAVTDIPEKEGAGGGAPAMPAGMPGMGGGMPMGM
jgi:chaperonin GroEL